MKKLFLISAIGLFLMGGQYIAGAASAGFDDGAGPADQGSVSKRGKIEDYELHQSIIEGKSIDTISALINDLSPDDCSEEYDSTEDELNGFTPAMLAVRFNRLDVLKKLYEKGVDLNLVGENYRNGNEFTVLSLAFSYCNFDIAHWLFDLKDEEFVVDRYVPLDFHGYTDEHDCRLELNLPPFFILISYLNKQNDHLSRFDRAGAHVGSLCNPEEKSHEDQVDKAYSLLCRYFNEDPRAAIKVREVFDESDNHKDYYSQRTFSEILREDMDTKFSEKLINILERLSK